MSHPIPYQIRWIPYCSVIEASQPKTIRNSVIQKIYIDKSKKETTEIIYKLLREARP